MLKNIRQDGDHFRVEFEGVLSFETADKLRNVLLSMVDVNVIHRVTINLSGLEYIDSSGLGVLLALNKQLSTGGCTLNLVSIPETLQNIVRMTNLHKMLNIYETPADVP